MIETGDLTGAIRVHQFFQPPASGPYMHETDESDLLECFNTPLPAFSFCSNQELLDLRIRMAVALVEGREFTLTPDVSFPWRHRMTPKATVHNFFAAIAAYRNLSEWRRSGVVLRAKIVNSNDGGCRACIEAAHDYGIHDVPSIPIRNCMNLDTIGCRCIAIPSKIEGIDL